MRQRHLIGAAAIAITLCMACRARCVGSAVRTESAEPDSWRENLSAEDYQAFQLTDAARRGDIERVEALLAEGVDVNTLRPCGFSALHWAASTGQLEMVKFLLQHGADFNLKSGKQRTPLWEAEFNNQDEVAEFLRQQGGTE